METIINYLDNIFMHLPNTAEVRKAKDELAQMMEDKYAELIAEGKTENEAVGTVISEFGNLSELAEALGIESVMNTQKNENSNQQGNYTEADAGVNRRLITMDEALEYLKDKADSAFKIALGVMLILLGLTATIMVDALITNHDFGGIFLILFVAVAVALFIFAGTKMNKWEFMSKMPCAIDYATSKAIESEKKQNQDSLIVMRTIGIVMCIVSFVPAAILDEFNPKFYKMTADDIGGALLFVFVGIGVFMIVYSSIKLEGYKKLLFLNDQNTVSGNYVNYEENNVENANSLRGIIKSVYWPTVTCIYLSWSFLTFDWHISWIIWPIAAVAFPLVNILFPKD